MNKTYCIAINGQRAVNLGYKLQKGYCYTAISDHGVKIGQLEVVLDEPGTYKGFPIKWVDVSFIKPEHIDIALTILSQLGFKGCKAIIIEEIDDKQTELCGTII